MFTFIVKLCVFSYPCFQGLFFCFRSDFFPFSRRFAIFGTILRFSWFVCFRNEVFRNDSRGLWQPNRKRIRKNDQFLSRLASTSILVRFKHPSKVKNGRHNLRSDQHNLVHNKFTNTVVAIILLRSTCIHFIISYTYIENSNHRVRHAYIMIINNVLYYVLFW